MLSAIRKIETGHATGCTFAGQIQLGKVLRQLRADGAKIQSRLPSRFDADALVAKVQRVAPRLQFDKLETCSLHDFDFDDACVKRRHADRSVGEPTREHRLHLRPHQ